MDDDDFWADKENEEQVGPGGGLADRAVRGKYESTEDSDGEDEDEDEDEDGGNEDEGDEENEGEGDEDMRIQPPARSRPPTLPPVLSSTPWLVQEAGASGFLTLAVLWPPALQELGALPELPLRVDVLLSLVPPVRGPPAA
eukprot:jgi/Tetstr1/421613/TSEL_012554.t1